MWHVSQFPTHLTHHSISLGQQNAVENSVKSFAEVYINIIHCSPHVNRRCCYVVEGDYSLVCRDLSLVNPLWLFPIICFIWFVMVSKRTHSVTCPGDKVRPLCLQFPMSSFGPFLWIGMTFFPLLVIRDIPWSLCPSNIIDSLLTKMSGTFLKTVGRGFMYLGTKKVLRNLPCHHC